MSGQSHEDFDYSDAFSTVMEKGGIERPLVEEYLALWHAQRLNGSRTPCPICYAAGGWGDLDQPRPQGDGYALKCRNCKVSIPLAKIELHTEVNAAPPLAKTAKKGNARWELVYSSGTGPGSWTWRLLRIDGSIEQISEPQQNFGKAVRDAMNAGFSPKRDFWVIKRQNWITTFHRGTIISTGPDDQVIARNSNQTRVRPTDEGAETSRELRPNVPEKG